MVPLHDACDPMSFAPDGFAPPVVVSAQLPGVSSSTSTSPLLVRIAHSVWAGHEVCALVIEAELSMK